MSMLPTRTLVFTKSIHTSGISQKSGKSNHPCFKKRYEEPAYLPLHPAQFSTIRFERYQSVQEIVILGENGTFKKQSNRGTNNPWRRYGALRKLHEIGGFAPANYNKKERKNRDGLIYIAKESKPPSPPTSNQMTLNKVREKTKNVCSNRLTLHVPKNATVELCAQKLAEQVKNYVEANENLLHTTSDDEK
ncbi:unnamed protein product [Caenorhabditis bovis]|uniref:Uncharacterized protein n=1 Tax=Caenorhabditis bovis TaxID=2654633 RepID=A0A8S1ECE4_9PELO|nr:unnamed protein product [Caenorhabditis bovis]